jgi:hypothetical protein
VGQGVEPAIVIQAPDDKALSRFQLFVQKGHVILLYASFAPGTSHAPFAERDVQLSQSDQFVFQAGAFSNAKHHSFQVASRIWAGMNSQNHILLLVKANPILQVNIK